MVTPVYEPVPHRIVNLRLPSGEVIQVREDEVNTWRQHYPTAEVVSVQPEIPPVRTEEDKLLIAEETARDPTKTIPEDATIVSTEKKESEAPPQKEPMLISPYTGYGTYEEQKEKAEVGERSFEGQKLISPFIGYGTYEDVKPEAKQHEGTLISPYTGYGTYEQVEPAPYPQQPWELTATREVTPYPQQPWELEVSAPVRYKEVPLEARGPQFLSREEALKRGLLPLEASLVAPRKEEPFSPYRILQSQAEKAYSEAESLKRQGKYLQAFIKTQEGYYKELAAHIVAIPEEFREIVPGQPKIPTPVGGIVASIKYRKPESFVERLFVGPRGTPTGFEVSEELRHFSPWEQGVRAIPRIIGAGVGEVALALGIGKGIDVARKGVSRVSYAVAERSTGRVGRIASRVAEATTPYRLQKPVIRVEEARIEAGPMSSRTVRYRVEYPRPSIGVSKKEWLKQREALAELGEPESFIGQERWKYIYSERKLAPKAPMVLEEHVAGPLVEAKGLTEIKAPKLVSKIIQKPGKRFKMVEVEAGEPVGKEVGIIEKREEVTPTQFLGKPQKRIELGREVGYRPERPTKWGGKPLSESAKERLLAEQLGVEPTGAHPTQVRVGRTTRQMVKQVSKTVQKQEVKALVAFESSAKTAQTTSILIAHGLRVTPKEYKGDLTHVKPSQLEKVATRIARSEIPVYRHTVPVTERVAVESRQVLIQKTVPQFETVPGLVAIYEHQRISIPKIFPAGVTPSTAADIATVLKTKPIPTHRFTLPQPTTPTLRIPQPTIPTLVTPPPEVSAEPTVTPPPVIPFLPPSGGFRYYPFRFPRYRPTLKVHPILTGREMLAMLQMPRRRKKRRKRRR